MSYVLRRAGYEVVDAQDMVALGKESLAKVAAHEACAARH
jgi:hypothetical protein